MAEMSDNFHFMTTPVIPRKVYSPILIIALPEKAPRPCTVVLIEVSVSEMRSEAASRSIASKRFLGSTKESMIEGDSEVRGSGAVMISAESVPFIYC